MTKYDYIFSEFKDKITDPDLLAFSDCLQVEMLVVLMTKAISRCKRICSKKVDLSNRDDEVMEFSEELPDEVIDIITEWMIVFWLKPYLNNTENLENSLSTKDFSVFSPANLLEKIGDRYDKSRKQARSLTNEYSYIINGLKALKS